MVDRLLRALIILALAAASAGGAATAPSASGPPGPFLGTSWYPEQWPEARWEADLALMEQAGLRMVRVGEYAWSSLEPTEGAYKFDWLERAIQAAARHHLMVVLGTPSDAPAAWVTSRYPETLRVTEDGRRLEPGARRQFSYSSRKYRELCRNLDEQLARRFGHNSAVIGWQIGNEYTDESFDPEARQDFQAWLKARYGSLAALNLRWVTAYWSETYGTWAEIPMGTGRGNPGLLLDYKRFVTDEWRSFQRNQIDAVRRFADPRQFMTTNLGGLGWADRFNRRTIAADLDVASWDDYLGIEHFDSARNASSYSSLAHVDPYRNGATHDLVRGWKGRSFWVMEMPAGFVDWATVSSSLDRGEFRAMAWEAIGHGAEGVAFWQWRAALNGQEQYHGTAVGADGAPVPFYSEARDTAAEFARATDALTGTSVHSRVALLHDYDSRWAIDIHPQTQRYDQVQMLLSYYQPLRESGESVDIVDPSVPLDGYRLVVAPSLNVIPRELGRHLADYVRRGGHLVLGPRSGMKDEFNALDIARQPGPLVPILGGRVEQFYALAQSVPVSGPWGSGRASIWAEWLSTSNPATEVLLRYGAANGWIDGQPAALRRNVGAGWIYYIGADLDAALMTQVVAGLLGDAGLTPTGPAVPSGVELCRREGADREVLLLINFSSAAVEVPLPRPLTDVLRGGVATSVKLPRYGVAVLSGAAPAPHHQ
jgi:beta-galactosidase